VPWPALPCPVQCRRSPMRAALVIACMLQWSRQELRQLSDTSAVAFVMRIEVCTLRGLGLASAFRVRRLLKVAKAQRFRTPGACLPSFDAAVLSFPSHLPQDSLPGRRFFHRQPGLLLARLLNVNLPSFSTSPCIHCVGLLTQPPSLLRLSTLSPPPLLLLSQLIHPQRDPLRS